MDVRLGVAGGMKRVYFTCATYSACATYPACATCTANSTYSTCSCAPVGEPSVRLIHDASLGAASSQRGNAAQRHHGNRKYLKSTGHELLQKTAAKTLQDAPADIRQYL